MELLLNRSGARPLGVYGYPLPTPRNRPPSFGPPHMDLLKCLSFQMSHRIYGTDYSREVPRLQCLCLGCILLLSPFEFDNLSYLRFGDVPFLGTQLSEVLETALCNPNPRELLLSQSLGTAGFYLQPLSKPRVSLHFPGGPA